MRHAWGVRTRVSWPGLARRAVGLAVALGLTLGVGAGAAYPGAAQEASATPWEQLPGAGGTANRLYTPSSGALLATTSDGLYRSDDAGTTWRDVPLPSHVPNVPPLLTVDPTNHDVIYARSTDGLSKTTDGGATWSVVLPRDDAFPSLFSVKVSPADPNLVYVMLVAKGGRVVRFLRSNDAGATWALLEEDGHEFLACGWSVSFIAWHPTDPARLFRAVTCNHEGSPIANLEQSVDQGNQWSTMLDTGSVPPASIKDPRSGPVPSAKPAPTGQIVPTPPGGRLVASPTRLLGGTGTNPSRFYLALDKDYRGGGSSLLRSDDDGHTWTMLFDAIGGGTATPANDARPNITIGSIACDPSSSDTLYAAFAEQVKGGAKTVTVRVSTDAGTTWTDIGTLPVKFVYDLALGIDGANLYAATDQGVWRLHVR